MVQMYYQLSRITVRSPIRLRPSPTDNNPDSSPTFPDWRLSSRAKLLIPCLTFLSLFPACNRLSNTIAVIPRSCGTVLWEPEHAGAQHAAQRGAMNVYWNAPMREDDVAGQIDLLEKVVAKKYAGIILTPDQTLPLRSPVRCIVDRGIPLVVVGTNLGIAPNKKLSYVLNDDAAGGQMAARRIGKILDGKGSVVILGINPQLSGITIRGRSFENTLAQEFPGIHVVARRLGYYSVAQEQQVAEDVLHRVATVDAIVALSHVSTRGAFYALVEFGRAQTIKLVGFDQDLMPPLRTGGIDSVVMESTYDMGRIAMEAMEDEVHGRSVAGVQVVSPILMTSDNIDSREIQRQLRADWWAPQ